MAIGSESPGWDQLSLEEKLELVGRLWDDIVASVPPGGLLTDAQREELRRRVADAQANPEDYVAWEDALAATLKRLGS
ncbi:MAG TPA: addiction module protein [Gemmataceae bacterium]|jgi:putative addiction module component (TIGR02574 family)|nr:addiction module protein [Gemmataceae bacterium]